MLSIIKLSKITYDFVFIYKNKVFATMLTKFYKPDELLDKPDSELEKLMKK